MRRTVPAFLLVGSLALLAGLGNAEPKPDTQGAKVTREKKLKTKISVSLENQMLRDVIKELVGAVKDNGGGTVRIKPMPNEGITLTSRFSIQAKDESLEDVLDKLLKEKNWGYVINVGSPGDQDDGAILLVTKPLRGYPDDGKESKKDDKAKKETVKKEMVKEKKDDSKKGTGDADKDEKTAAGRLNIAELHLENKKPEKAKAILEDIIKKYPNTKAAEKARSMLESIGK